MALTTIPVELASLDGAVTVNESSADADFRVESDGDANMLFVDGGNNAVGIGTGSPTSPNSVNRFLHIHNADHSSLVMSDDQNTWEIVSNNSLSIRDGTDTRVSISNAGTVTFEHPIVLQSGATQGLYIENNAGNAVTPRITNDANDHTVIRPGKSGGAVQYNNFANTAERMRLTDAGNLNIGMTGGVGLLSVAGMMQMYTLTGVAAASGSVTLQLTQALHAGGAAKQGSMLLIIGGYGNNLTGSVQALYQVSGYMFYDHASTSSIQSISNNVSQGSVAVARNGTGYDITLTNSNASYSKSLVVTAILAAY